MQATRTSPITGLILRVEVAFVAAVVGGLLTGDPSAGWYGRLEKPAWTPPNWLFGPVWTVLYALMGVAAWLVWRRVGFAGGALTLFFVQLALNAAWSGLFFALEAPGLALVEMAALWLAILGTLLAFWHALPLAGALLAPYLLWVSFAAALNFAIWRLN